MRPIHMDSRDKEEFVNQVHKMFGEKKLRPVFSSFNIHRVCGRWMADRNQTCVLGGFLHGEEIQSEAEELWSALEKKLGWWNCELNGFVSGYDGKAAPSSSYNQEERAAWELGRMVRRTFING